jgi:flagellin
LKVNLLALDITAKNLQTCKLCISDVDVSNEMTKNQPLAQAGISIFAQANTMPQMALNLIR